MSQDILLAGQGAIPEKPRPARRERERAYPRSLGWALVAALLVLWEVSTGWGWVKSHDLPQLSRILLVWRDGIADGTVAGDILGTLGRALSGFALAALVGSAIGLAMGTWRLVDALLEPLVELFRPVPSTALVPLAILVFGIGSEMKIFIAFLGALFPILINAWSGARSISPTLRETAKTFRLGERERLIGIVLPAAAPSIFVGLKLGLTVALVITVVTEMIAGNAGMGYRILFNQQMLLMPELYAGVFTLALAGYTLNHLFTLIERRVLFWSERVRNTLAP